MRILLADADIDDALTRLPGWQRQGDALVKQFQFEHFRAAIWFMNAAAAAAEQMDHHPEWSNVYNRVMVRLTTHDSGGITHNDIRLAEAMENAAR